MRRLKPKTIREQSEGFTKQATIWMRPDIYEATRHLAIDEGCTFQAVVDRALERYAQAARRKTAAAR